MSPDQTLRACHQNRHRNFPAFGRGAFPRLVSQRRKVRNNPPAYCDQYGIEKRHGRPAQALSEYQPSRPTMRRSPTAKIIAPQLRGIRFATGPVATSPKMNFIAQRGAIAISSMKHVATPDTIRTQSMLRTIQFMVRAAPQTRNDSDCGTPD